MGGPRQPQTFQSNFPASPKSLPASPHPGGGGAPPSQGDVSPAPPPAGALWPNMANTAVLGSWDRLGGRGGGPWPGLLAAGEGEGSPGGGGGAARTSQGEKRDHRPSRWLTGYMQDPLSGHTPGGPRHPPRGPQVTPHPTQPCPGALCVQVMLLCGCPD